MTRITLTLMTMICCLITMLAQAQETEELEDLSVAELMRLQAQAAADFKEAQEEYEAAKARHEQATLNLEESCSEEERAEIDRGAFYTFQGLSMAMPGMIDKSIIDRVIKMNLDDIRACAPGSTERIWVDFLINNKGFVTSAEVISSGMNDDYEQCIVDIFMDMEYPRPQMGTYVHLDYPIVLGRD